MIKGFVGSKKNLSAFVLFLWSGGLVVVMKYFSIMSCSLLVEVVFIKLGSFSFNFPVLLSWENYIVSMVVCLISGSVLIYSGAYMGGDYNYSRFINLVCLFVLSMNLLVFIPSMFFLFLGWDGLGIVSFILVIYYQNKGSLGSGMITVLTNRLGDVFLFLSIMMGSCLGYWSWVGYGLTGGKLVAGADFLVLAMGLVVAGMTKSAQFPFCAWLPAAMAAPTPVSALVHSSTLVTAGVFLLCRFSGVLLSSVEVMSVLYVLSLLTMLMSGVICCMEWDMKKVIAFSTLSQLGVMMFSVSLGLINFSLFHLMTHAVFKALMFLCAGFVIYYSSHSQDFRCIGGFWWSNPLMGGSLVVSAFCLGGMPFLSGFYSKDLIIESFLMGSISFWGLGGLILATSLTVGYSVRLCEIVIMGKKGLLEGSVEMMKGSYVFPLILLEVVGVFEGSLIQSVFDSFSSFEFVMGYVKKVLVGSLLFGLFLSYLTLQTKKMGAYTLMSYIYSIMFLGEISGQISSKSGLSVSKKCFQVLDQGVFEKIFGGKGLAKLGDKLGCVTFNLLGGGSMYKLGFYALMMFFSFSVILLVFSF